MVSSFAVVALTFAGHDIQDIDGIFLDLFSGGPGDLAAVRGTDWVVPALDGREAGNRRVDRRVVELRGWVCGTGATEAARRGDYWTNRNTLASWFDPTAIAVLAGTFPGIGARTLNCRPLSIVDNPLNPSFAYVSVELESIDPDWA